MRGRYSLRHMAHAVVLIKADHVTSVCVAPGGDVLEHATEGSYVRIPLPKIDGYMMVVVEKLG